MSSLRSKRCLRIVGLCLLLVPACKPTEVAEQPLSPRTVSKLDDSNSRSIDTATRQTSFLRADDPLEAQTFEFIDQTEIDDPILFARRVVALSKGESTQFLDAETFETEDIGTRYDTLPSDEPFVEPPPVPELGPQSTQHAQMMRALQEARMRDIEDRENAKWAALNQQRLDYEDAMEAPPRPLHVTRFDRGLGMEIDFLVNAPRIRTTGHSTLRRETERARPDCMFMNQVIGDQTRPSSFVQFAAFPVDNGGRPSFSPPPDAPPGCNDGRDNNANGLPDAQDPMCWADRTDPRTYAPHLSESEPFNPFGAVGNGLGPTAGPALPSANLQLGPSSLTPVTPSLPTPSANTPSVPAPGC